MNSVCDPIKNKLNIQKHRIDLADVEGVFSMIAPLPLKSTTMTKNVL